MTQFIPSNRADFECLMSDIDAALAARSVDLYSRPLQAFSELAKRIAEPLELPPRGYTPPVDSFRPPVDLAAHALQWYESLYGDRLKARLDLGDFALSIRGEAWLVHVPQFFGSVEFFIPVPGVPRRPAPASCNVLTQIDGLPEGLREALIISELQMVMNTFRLALNTFLALDTAPSSDLLTTSRSDHRAAVNHIVGRSCHYGQAKWSALQAAEKSSKVLIVHRGSSPPRHHELAKLSPVAGMTTRLSEGLLRRVQCTAEIRYQPETTTLDEAVTAHHAALDIAFECATELRRRNVA